MKVTALTPPPTEKVLFRLSSFRLVPAAPGCYVLATSEGIILYVGLAINLKNRFQQHLENPEKTKVTELGRAFLYHWRTYDEQNLNKLERSWLNQFSALHGCRPTLNKMDSPVG
jgi:excinuclease UvrABC nuclease subunit